MGVVIPTVVSVFIPLYFWVASSFPEMNDLDGRAFISININDNLSPGSSSHLTFFSKLNTFFTVLLGDCVMVARQTLDLLVRVRILLPQHVALSSSG